MSWKARYLPEYIEGYEFIVKPVETALKYMSTYWESSKIIHDIAKGIGIDCEVDLKDGKPVLIITDRAGFYGIEGYEMVRGACNSYLGYCCKRHIKVDEDICSILFNGKKR